jgi:tripartite-type tricarboxylate transporter receptor subunit TctC
MAAFRNPALRGAAAALVIALTCSAGAWAQTRPAGGDLGYPTKPVRLVVPLAPGGGVDIMARLLAARLTDRWGYTVVVDNRPGASGAIGTEIVSRSPADGYTLLLVSNSHITAPLVYKRQTYDPINGFAPIIQTSAQSFLLVVNSAVPVNTVRELIAYARARKLNFTSSDTGSASHLSGELFKMMAGIDMTHVPYKSSAPALQDTAAGHVPVIFVNSLPAMAYIKTGRLKAVAATAARRISSLPDVPTIAESGLPGFDTNAWNGMLAPAGTPRRLVLGINDAVGTVLRVPEVRERFINDGTEPVGGSPEAFHAMLVSEQKRWAAVVKNMKLDVY